MNAGEIVFISYLVSVPLVAYLTGRLSGDGLGMAAIAWPMMALVIFAAPFLALNWITKRANEQYWAGRK